MRVLAIILLVVSFNVLSCDDGLIKENNLSIPPNSIAANTVTEQQFKSLMWRFEKFFAPQIEEEHNSEFIIYHSWNSGTVNAYADRKPRKVEITIFGGLARHKAMTLDGVALTLCHELGHHFGGYPKKATNKWSSAEGQADYYSTAKCMRRFWANDNNAYLVRNAPLTVLQECRASFSSANEAALCARISMAGKSLALLFQDIEHDSIEPKFETPAREIVSVINYMHPFSQCRLDTYFQGALCQVSERDEFNDQDETIGSCHPRLGYKRGLRPRCWFVHR